ncbi:biotin--[acetyl-CoA-carboxylase] ligase [Anaerovibrio sp.]|uniref:biotin--[acetyl-CoA-carboxylase] ligase n=1 Tax=Anaerovibrio sp. TaxID=1872532 RepID=UPI003F1821C9
MRSKILELLRSRQEGCISGEEIASRLGVSRTAVWKHIKELKAAGYQIESRARSGYCLLGAPDRLLPELITHNLQTRLLGQTVISFEDIPSTNDEGKKVAAAGADEGTVIVSEMQSTGKGRLERSFFCPRGGVWFSVILRPDFLPQEAPKCTLLAAVAVAKAMREQGLEAGIKWPNDIYCRGRKLTGILTEMSAEMDRINYVVIGTGINVNIPQSSFPADIRDKAGSMSDMLGHDVNRVSFLQSVLRHMEELYVDVLKNGFAGLLDQWRRYSITLGQEINVLGMQEAFAGTAKDIDDDGALLVETDGGIRRVLAGDVSIRPRN